MNDAWLPEGNEPNAGEQENVPPIADDTVTGILEFQTFEQQNEVAMGDEMGEIAAKAKKSHRWLWILLGVLVLLAAVLGGGFWYFQSHALPGVNLWGHSMIGRSQKQIANEIQSKADEISIPVSYNGKTKQASLKDLGLSVDADKIASQVVNAKRNDSFFQKYAFWVTENLDTDPFDAETADASTIGKALGVDSQTAMNAGLRLNDDATAFDVVPGKQGTGINVIPVAQEAQRVLESLGRKTAQTVTVKDMQINPDISDDQATAAKTVADGFIANPIAIKIGDHQIAAFDVKVIVSAMTVSADNGAKLAAGQTRNGILVFDATKLQQYYDDSIKPNFHADRVDGDVIVNSVGDVLQTNTEGHDGIVISDGSDSNVGRDAAKALAKGGGTVSVQGTVDAQNEKRTTRTVVVSLSGHTVTAIENGQTLRVMHMSAGQGNDYLTGQCQPSGDLCTPTYCDVNSYDNCTPDGDFKVWLKYQSQDMSGNLTLSNGSQESWNVKNVGFVNYFSKTGCAIHRIATQSAFNDASVQAMGANTSHGCVGIGWDQAEWFYNWCLKGTTVHVQA